MWETATEAGSELYPVEFTGTEGAVIKNAHSVSCAVMTRASAAKVPRNFLGFAFAALHYAVEEYSFAASRPCALIAAVTAFLIFTL